MKIRELKFLQWLSSMLVYLEWGCWFRKFCREKFIWIRFLDDEDFEMSPGQTGVISTLKDLK